MSERNLWIALVAFMVSVGCSTKKEDAAPWKILFNGKDLSGWQIRGGKATYAVEDDGVIAGTTVVNTPNTFLCTDDTYGDFILEYEVLLKDSVNSGVQFRSISVPEFQNGRVHGYQCELDPSARRWTGGIYDEARRGWLYPLTGDDRAMHAFKFGEWNKFRIEAIGDTIKVWVNDIPTTHLVDDRTPEGFIALQVHGIGNNVQEEGVAIRWRNIRILTEDLTHYATATDLPARNNYNKLTHSEKDWGWSLLWDGQTAAGWVGDKKASFPEKGWEMTHGELIVLESGGEESEHGGDIVTEKLYGDFDLRVDFKITPGANSGIKYYVDTTLNKSAGSGIGLEYQILDDDIHPDAKLGNHEGSRTVASLYDLIKAENKKVNPVGTWNHARIVSSKGHVTHWLNGHQVLAYDRGSEAFRKLVAESKYAKWKDFGEAATGHILLQDHGNRVSFRNIFIKEL